MPGLLVLAGIVLSLGLVAALGVAEERRGRPLSPWAEARVMWASAALMMGGVWGGVAWALAS